MTWKRCVAAASIFALLISIGVIIALAMPLDSRAMKAKFDQIENGMETKDVARVFDGKLGQQVRTKDVVLFEFIPDDIKTFVWQDEDGSGSLIIFQDDRVINKAWMDSEETVFERIRRRLYLR